MSHDDVKTDDSPDPLTVGRRIRDARTRSGKTLSQFADAVGRAPSQMSMIENGKRELRLSELSTIAKVLDTSIDDLLDPRPPDKRAALEIALVRAQASPLFETLQIEPLALRKSLPDDAIETILALHDELVRIHEQRASTPESARHANSELRAEMRQRHNYIPELEEVAADLLKRIEHGGGPLSQSAATTLAKHLGFTLHYVDDLPATTRSLTDKRNGRIYFHAHEQRTDRRVNVLQALAASVLGQDEPRDFGELLVNRLRSNYLAGAMLVPEESAVPQLAAAKAARDLAVEDLRDAFAVSYEMAAHRFTNLATEHLDLPVHFIKVDSTGIVSKAYENDNVSFPRDALGSIEGQRVCRWWSARQVFEEEDRYSLYHQYTDKPNGTYWCTSAVQTSPVGDFSVSVGTQYAHSKWFRGRETTRRQESSCPDPSCCRQVPSDVESRWAGQALPSARLNSSLLAAVPDGATTGIERIKVYEFLDAHAPIG